MAQSQNPQKNQGNQRNANHENKSMDEEEMIQVENQEKQKGDLFEILGDEDERKSSMKSQKMSVKSSKEQIDNLSSDNYEKKKLQVNNEMFMYPESSSSESSRLLNQTPQRQILQQHLQTRPQNVNNVTNEQNPRQGRDYSHLDRCRCRTQNQPCSNRNFCACIFNRRRCTSLCGCQLFECTNPNQEMLQQRIAIIQEKQRIQYQEQSQEIGIEDSQSLDASFVEFDFFWMNPQFHEEERQKEKGEGAEDKMQEQQDEQKSEQKEKQSKK